MNLKIHKIKILGFIKNVFNNPKSQSNSVSLLTTGQDTWNICCVLDITDMKNIIESKNIQKGVTKTTETDGENYCKVRIYTTAGGRGGCRETNKNLRAKCRIQIQQHSL